MDLQKVLTQIESWSAEERLRLVKRMWDGLIEQGHEPGLIEAQTAEIDLRLAEDDAAPDDVVSWKEVKSLALGRAGR